MNTPSSVSLVRRQREREETRQRILEAARQMLVRHGYEATTMRAIAARIGYTATALYHHFKDKDALVAELAAVDFRALGRALQEAGSIADPVARLERIGEAYVEFGLSHPMQYQFLFMTRHHEEGRHEHPHGDPGLECYGFLRQTCAEAIATGRLWPEFVDADELAQIAWGSLHGIVALQVTLGDEPKFRWADVRAEGRKLTRTITRGLLRTP
jgi:AcrR family transcriptional regulator